MKLKKLIPYLTLVTLFFLLVSYILKEENQQHKDKILIKLVAQSLKDGHYQKLNIDNNFSEDVFETYINRLDYTKKFLLKSDIDKLSKYKHEIDDELENLSFEFFDFSIEIINKRIVDAESYFEEILEKPFNFTKDETIELDSKKVKFCDNKNKLKDSWRKALKYQTMVKLEIAIKLQKDAKENKDTIIEEKSFETMEKDARAKVLKAQKDWFKRMKKLEKNDRLSVYINSITNTYDLHTGYFPPKDKEDFDISMSGKLEGIGAQLTERDGYIKVAEIVPGSASWKQGELEAGDLIIKVAQGEEEAVDVVDMRLDKAVKLIRGKKGTEVRLTVKKIDGRIQIISIIRDVVNIEETYAKSVVLSSANSKSKIGYIDLPKFYVDFEDRFGRNCSDDIEKELKKLNNDNVDAIIFDLRNNGGGSLRDAVDIAGFFIKKGPIVQVKSRTGYPQVLNDTDPKIQFDKPVVFLVNVFSASASEILAAALQDYDRAIIIGSPSTFGKGTVQRFFDLDDYLTSYYSDIKPLGAIKLTTQKFYRINGDATQLKGVIPDIILPDLYSNLELGEKDQDFALKWDETIPVDFEKWDKPINNVNNIISRSNKRVNENPVFNVIEEKSKSLKDEKDKTERTLNLKKYIAKQEKLEIESEKFDDLLKLENDLSVFALTTDAKESANDSIAKERAEKWYKNLKKDIYLEEAFYVAEDVLKGYKK